MGSAPRRVLTVGSLVAAITTVLTASLAWACTGLATLSSSASSARPGQTVEIAGQGYGKSGGYVSVRFDSGWGEVLATAQPDHNGKFRASVPVPALTPGEHVLLAIQSDAAGQSVLATASLPLKVVAGSPGPAVSPLGAGASGRPASAPLAASPPWALLLTLGLGSTALLAVGCASVALLRRPALAPMALIGRPARRQ